MTELVVFLTASCVLFVLVLVRMADLVTVLREVQRQRAEGRFQRLTEQVTDVLSICRHDAVIQYVTPSVQSLLGHPAGALLDTSMLDLVHPDDRDRVSALLGTGEQGGRVGPIECRMRRADGEYIVAETVGRVVDDADLSGYLFTTRAVTERKTLEDQLTHRAFHDELTGLANRALLADRVHHALERRGTPYRHLAVLVVDLDDFKTINDSLGRAAGDGLLRATADRLRSCLRSADTAARLGSDEFAMRLEHLDDAAEAARIAGRVLAVLRQPLSIGGREIQPQASVGIALPDPDRPPDADELLRNADVAMHMAKRQGRNRFAYFAPSMHAGLVEKLDLTEDLRGAIERHELEGADIASNRLRELKALGVHLAVDDFGTGYSSLSRLHAFPIDILKIPKPFVDGVARGPEHSALARAILDLALALGLQVVAEGIEDAEQSRELRRLGCPVGQGFLFSRAVPAAAFTALLAQGAFAMAEA